MHMTAWMLLYIGDELCHIYTYKNRSGWGLDLGRGFSLPRSCFLSVCLSISMRPVILNSYFFLF